MSSLPNLRVQYQPASGRPQWFVLDVYFCVEISLEYLQDLLSWEALTKQSHCKRLLSKCEVCLQLNLAEICLKHLWIAWSLPQLSLILYPSWPLTFSRLPDAFSYSSLSHHINFLVLIPFPGPLYCKPFHIALPCWPLPSFCYLKHFRIPSGSGTCEDNLAENRILISLQAHPSKWLNKEVKQSTKWVKCWFLINRVTMVRYWMNRAVKVKLNLKL